MTDSEPQIYPMQATWTQVAFQLREDWCAVLLEMQENADQDLRKVDVRNQKPLTPFFLG